MDTRKLAKFSDGLLIFVRGPIFLSIVSLLLLVAAVPAEAVLLQGYLNQDTETVSVEATQGKTEQPTLKAQIADQSFPASFEGVWHCLTVVVDSAIASVPIGQQVESDVAFLKKNDGRVVAQWYQPGWSESATSIMTISPVEANLDRTNFFNGRSSLGIWAARSRDNYIQLAENKIVASSYVDQYINGRFIGRYRTSSTLMRNEPQHKVALGR